MEQYSHVFSGDYNFSISFLILFLLLLLLLLLSLLALIHSATIDVAGGVENIARQVKQEVQRQQQVAVWEVDV